MRRSVAVLLGMFAVVFGTRVATAQGTREAARERFREAERAAEAGDHRAAALAYEASYRNVPTAEAMYDAAREWEAARELGRAADDYEAAIDKTDLHGPQLADAKRRLAELDAALGVVAVTGPAGARVSLAHLEGATLPARVHLPAGEYDVRARGAGGEASTVRVRVVARQTTAADIQFPPPVSAPVRSTEPQPEMGPKPSSTPTLRTVGWVTLGAAALLAGTSVVFYAKAQSARDDFVNTGNTSVPLHDAAVGWRAAAYGGYAATGVAAALGIVLLVASGASTKGSDAFLRMPPASNRFVLRF